MTTDQAIIPSEMDMNNIHVVGCLKASRWDIRR